MTYIYFFPEVIMYLLALQSHRLSYKTVKLCFFVICAMWVIIFGLRAYTVGNDTIGYSLFFQNKNVNYEGYGNVSTGTDLELGFLFIARLLKKITDSPTVFFTFISGWMFYMIYKIYLIACGYQRCIGNLLVVFIIANTFVTLMVATRQATSICVFLTGLYLILRNRDSYNGNWKEVILNKKFLIGLIIIALSVTVHKSSIILVPILICAFFLRFKKRTMYIMIGVSLVFSMFFMSTLGNLFSVFFVTFGNFEISSINSLVMEQYSADFGGNSQKIMTYMAWVVPAILTIHLSDEKQYKSFFFNCYIFSVCTFLLFSTSFLIERINTILVLLGFTQFLPAIVTRTQKWRYVYIFFIFLMLAKAFMRYGNWPVNDSCIPYYFFWE